MTKENEFQKWAKSLSGCDGGNRNADIWLCGIEWGTSGWKDKPEKKKEYYETGLMKEVKSWNEDKLDKDYDWKEHNKWTYSQSFAKLYSAIIGKNADGYEKHLEDFDKDAIFKMNLYPIAFKDTTAALWEKHGLHETTGFKNKDEFRIWCLLNRFPQLPRLVNRDKHFPKLIICTGVTYVTDFLTCFSRYKGSDEIHSGEIEAASKANKNVKRSYYWTKVNDGKTVVFVIPFFSGASGLNSYHLLQKMGECIAKEVPELKLQ